MTPIMFGIRLERLEIRGKYNQCTLLMQWSSISEDVKEQIWPIPWNKTIIEEVTLLPNAVSTMKNAQS